MRRLLPLFLAISCVLARPESASAVTSTESVTSSFSGNGHNVSFDGRLFIVRDSAGWRAMLLRPEAITYLPNGLPDSAGPMWSPRTLLYDGGNPALLTENALAICETDPARAPFRCNDAGDETANGPYDCYDVWLIDSDAVTPADQNGFILRRRHLTLWVSNPKSPAADIHKFALSSTLEPMQPQLMGIEPTVTADGKLMVWQGHPDNDGKIDILMYSVNDDACSASGWSTPRTISHMAYDSTVVGTYRLAERTLRAADGEVFDDGDLVRGAYPWLMPSGDAIVFDASNMPCRAVEDPPGCGPRRNSVSVIGYPTNWGVAVVDGGVNPHTDDVVRLFFSSPGPNTFDELPVTDGLDVWPLMGSNTANYVELIFDDGLDGNYAGLWHFNENVDAEGNLDLTRVPDVSGYFNTGVLRGGLSVATSNNGVVGRALSFDGIDDRVEVASTTSLSPVNGITIDFWIRPTAEPDCDGNNNYRMLLGKGNIAVGSYSVVFEESRGLQVRFNVGGTQQSLWGPPVAANAWTHVSCEWDGPSGDSGCWYDDVEVTRETLAAGTLVATNDPLLIGGPGARAACPNGDGAFAGMLDEVSVSRTARRLGTAPPEPDAGPIDPGGADAGDIDPGGSDGGGNPGDGDDAGGCACRSSGGDGAGGALVVLLLSIAAVRRVGPARRSRR